MATAAQALAVSLVALGLVGPSTAVADATAPGATHAHRAAAGLAVTLDGGRRWTPLRHPATGPHSGREGSVSAVSLSVTRKRLLVRGAAGLFAGGARPVRASRTVRWCDVDDLRARVQTSGSVMSQPYLDIALRNAGTTACALRGYAGLNAFGAHLGGATHRLDVDVGHRGSYERVDPGAHRVVLRPLQRARLSIGTGTAYQGGVHLFEIDRLVLRLPHTGGPITMTGLSLDASAPQGRPIPVSLTAVYAGRPQVA